MTQGGIRVGKDVTVEGGKEVKKQQHINRECGRTDKRIGEGEGKS